MDIFFHTRTCLQFCSSYLTAWIIKCFAFAIQEKLIWRALFHLNEIVLQKSENKWHCHGSFDICLISLCFVCKNNSDVWQWNINIVYKYTSSRTSTRTYVHICEIEEFCVDCLADKHYAKCEWHWCTFMDRFTSPRCVTLCRSIYSNLWNLNKSFLMF